MSDARGLAEWNRTGALLAMIFNAKRDPKKTNPAKAEEFNPYTKKSRKRRGKPSKEESAAAFRAMKMLWVDNWKQ